MTAPLAGEAPGRCAEGGVRRVSAAGPGPLEGGRAGGQEGRLPLPASLSLVPRRWSLTHSERYALQFADGHRRYITENVSTLSPAPPSAFRPR